MVEVEIQLAPSTMKDNDKKRPPLHDISNHPAKKKCRECVTEFVEDESSAKLEKQMKTIKLSTQLTLVEQAASSSNITTVAPLSLSSKEHCPHHCLLGIPVETVFIILSFLPSCADSLNARLVCTSWDKLLRDKYLRKVIYSDDFLRQNEINYNYKVSLDYMKPHFQREINSHMRLILVDWLYEVAEEFSFHSETVFLCINILDRYLAIQQVPKSKLQLLGVVCLLIAAKFEEIQVPRVEQFVYISDNTCTREDIFLMEVHVLAKLKYFLSAPTSRTFLTKYFSAVRIGDATQTMLVDTLANYFIELSLLDYEMLKYPASLIAASALCLALHTNNFSAWTHTLEYYTQYSVVDQEMQDCVARLYIIYMGSPMCEYKAICKKYQPKFLDGFPKPAIVLPAVSYPVFHHIGS